MLEPLVERRRLEHVGNESAQAGRPSGSSAPFIKGAERAGQAQGCSCGWDRLHLLGRVDWKGTELKQMTERYWLRLSR